jgi:chromosome segregation ATPase
MPAPVKSTADQLAELRKRYELLNDKRVAAQTRLEQTTKALEQLKSEAMEQWGTSDLAALQAKLAQQQAENDKLRQDYEASLAAIEGDLKKIET